MLDIDDLIRIIEDNRLLERFNLSYLVYSAQF